MKPVLCILDYGMGNVKSIAGALRARGAEVRLSAQRDEVLTSQGLVLPGVGAFGSAMQRIREQGLDGLIHEYIASGRPLLGICLGMQLLFEHSSEFGEHTGLGVISGTVLRLGAGDASIKLPHVGWSPLNIQREDPLLTGVDEGDDMYFVHSYAVVPSDESTIITTTGYSGVEFVSTVRRGRVYGCQYHPEKSARSGLVIIDNFVGSCVL